MTALQEIVPRGAMVRYVYHSPAPSLAESWGVECRLTCWAPWPEEQRGYGPTPLDAVALALARGWNWQEGGLLGPALVCPACAGAAGGAS